MSERDAVVGKGRIEFDDPTFRKAKPGTFGGGDSRHVLCTQQINGTFPAHKNETKPAVRELLCQRCEQEYPVWYAANELWNKVTHEEEHFFCLTCFAILAEERGEIPTAWKLTQANDEDRSQAERIHNLLQETKTLTEEVDRLKNLLSHATKIVTDLPGEECEYPSLEPRLILHRKDGKWNGYDSAVEAFEEGR